MSRRNPIVAADRTRLLLRQTLSGTVYGVPSLLSLFAAGSRAIDLLPHLHQHAIEVTGGGCSLLFEHNPRNGSMQATSGYGLDELRTDPWIPGPDEAALVAQAFTRREATFVADVGRQMPDLAERLGTPGGAAAAPRLQATSASACSRLGIASRPTPRSTAEVYPPTPSSRRSKCPACGAATSCSATSASSSTSSPPASRRR